MFNFMKTTDAMRRMLVAREKIARRNPFFASIMFNAKLVESDKHQTIVTDGMHIFFNPEYVAQNDLFIEGDVLKCVMHGAMQHIGRRKYRDMERWNESCTLSVGPLVHQYFKQHPQLMANDGKFPDMAAEEIYELRDAEQQKQKGKGGKGSGDGKEEGEGNPGETPGGMVNPEPGMEEAAGSFCQAMGPEPWLTPWKRLPRQATCRATSSVLSRNYSPPRSWIGAISSGTCRVTRKAKHRVLGLDPTGAATVKMATPSCPALQMIIFIT